MLGYGCGVSQYSQFYDQNLDKYQVLPRPYRGSFETFLGDKILKEKLVLELAGQAKIFVWKSIEKRVTKKYWSKLKQKLTIAR